MKIDEGKRILAAALKSSGVLERSIKDITSELTETEAKEYRLAVGKVLMAIGEELIEPVFVLFPDIEPHDEEGWKVLRQELLG